MTTPTMHPTTHPSVPAGGASPSPAQTRGTAASEGQNYTERFRSLLVEAIRPHLDRPDEELTVARSMLCEELARRADYADDPRSRRKVLRRQTHCSLDEADLRKRDAGKGRLLGVRDYVAYKPDWGVSVSTIYRQYPSFAAAMKDAGLLAQESPRRGLTRKDGPRPGRPPHTWESVLYDLARMYEFNLGRRFSNRVYDRWANNASGHPAKSDRILKIAERERGWKGRGTFQLVCADALRMIRGPWRTQFPITASHLDLLLKLKTLEDGR